MDHPPAVQATMYKVNITKGSNIAEVARLMGKNKVLVKAGQDGKYVVDIDKVSFWSFFVTAESNSIVSRSRQTKCYE